MKRFAICFVCLGMILSLTGCQNNDTPSATTETKDYSQFAGIVADPTTWLEEFEALPIANENMTTDELRQLAVDAFRADLSFQWTPNKAVVYTYKSGDQDAPVNLPIGIAYSGLCYAAGKYTFTAGNIYKLLYYYDRETGVVDIEAMGDKMVGIITSACSSGAIQGWNRVSNSHGLARMETYTMFDSNIIPVGDYTYEPYVYDYNFGTKNATVKIVEFNGEQTMLESYAQMLPGDGLYTSPGWHVVMCSKAPVVVRNPDGTINAKESYITLCGQGNDGTHLSPYRIMKQENGVDLCLLGSVDYTQTFEKLLQSYNIPFTIPEFVGKDPVEPGKAWIGAPDSAVENNTALTVMELSNMQAHGNYNLCNLIIKVQDPADNELVSYNPSLPTLPHEFSVNMMGAFDLDKLTPYANGKNTIHICVQLANGELIDAFNTVLKID